jgi:hypothetical protein
MILRLFLCQFTLLKFIDLGVTDFTIIYPLIILMVNYLPRLNINIWNLLDQLIRLASCVDSNTRLVRRLSLLLYHILRFLMIFTYIVYKMIGMNISTWLKIRSRLLWILLFHIWLIVDRELLILIHLIVGDDWYMIPSIFIMTLRIWEIIAGRISLIRLKLIL